MKQGERIAFVALAIAVLGSAGFIAAYATGDSRLYEGIALACVSAAFATAALAWAFGILPHEQMVDERDDYPSSPVDVVAEDTQLARGHHDLSRGRALLGFVGAALGVFAVALIVPLRSFGPALGDSLFHTKWRKGSRLVREDGTPVRARDIEIDGFLTVFPQGAVGHAMSQTVLIRLPSDVPGTAQGYIAYSKVCTHAGCPVALYRRTAKQLMCPCHQSVFNVVGDGAVVSGPADHALPRLPIDVAKGGYLIATDDYPEPVGPGFWERS